MYSIGIDVGGTAIKGGIVDESGKIVSRLTMPMESNLKVESTLLMLKTIAQKLLEEKNLSYEDIKSVGIGIPGITDSKNGVVKFCSNINFENVDVAGFFKDKIPVPVFLGNDANSAALAESRYGAAKNSASSVTVTLGTGIGGGMVIEGKIITGAFFGGGEIGHHVICVDGIQCNCGRKGCWEVYASATAIINAAKEAVKTHKESEILILAKGNIENIDAKYVFDAYDSKDQCAINIIDKFYIYLAEGLVNVINILEPEVIVIGGGLSARGDKLIEPVKKLVCERIYGSQGLLTKLKAAELGNDSGIIGAALLGGVDNCRTL